jgi:hypothetical protein
VGGEVIWISQAKEENGNFNDVKYVIVIAEHLFKNCKKKEYMYALIKD